jgi:transcriptional regulator with XRE-family HTH domain
MQKAERAEPNEQRSSLDWPRWMRGLGRHTRRVREFLGFSQEQLARLAGVSQGAISRLEAGRGLATPIVVVVKIHRALRNAVVTLDPTLLSEDARRLLEDASHFAPGMEGEDFIEVPLTRDATLEELIRLYNELGERQQQKLLAVVRATVAALSAE